MNKIFNKKERKNEKKKKKAKKTRLQNAKQQRLGAKAQVGKETLV